MTCTRRFVGFEEFLIKALVYIGPRDVGMKDVPDAHIARPTDALAGIISTNIRCSDLHMYEAGPTWKRAACSSMKPRHRNGNRQCSGSRQGRTVGLRAIHHWLWVLPQDKI
jgi:hypothetical protein